MVNIALMENGVPVAGVVAAPARGLIWRGHVGQGAERLALPPGASRDIARERVSIRTRARPASGARVLISRSHLDSATDAFVDRLTRPEKIACGSALKFCLLADGTADIYPRLAPTSEWDIAAGHAVLLAAGGDVRKPDGSALRYGQARSFSSRPSSPRAIAPLSLVHDLLVADQRALHFRPVPLGGLDGVFRDLRAKAARASAL